MSPQPHLLAAVLSPLEPSLSLGFTARSARAVVNWWAGAADQQVWMGENIQAHKS